ncbi:MAG: APC family permease [Acidobacteriota bacterium]
MKQKEGEGLVRRLGAFDSTMMMVGIVIGSGIYTTTGLIAERAPSAGLILLVWVVGGLLTLAGALTYAELGTAMPHAGGHYVYLREAYGPLAAFLFGWNLFVVQMTGSIAALAVAFADYFSTYVPAVSPANVIFSTPVGLFGHSFQYSLSMGQLFAVAVILLLSAFNVLGVALGSLLQNLFTVIKIGTLLVFIALGLTVGRGAAVDFSLNPEGLEWGQLIVGFGIASIIVSWAFDGWHNINYIAGEIKDPARNLPRALFAGATGITLLYVLTNYIYLYAVPIHEMEGVVRIAELATSALYGGATAGLITVAIIISVFGALNGSIIVGPRVYYAMAADGLFFKKVSEVHSRFRTPAFSILLQAFWASMLTLSGTFEQLITFVMFVTVLFTVAAVASIFTLRKQQPDLARPYRTWGYPLVPLIFIVASTGILLDTLIERPVQALAGIGLTAIGIPVYIYWRRAAAADAVG